MACSDIYLAAAEAVRFLLKQRPGSFYALALIDMRRIRTEGILIETLQEFSRVSGTQLRINAEGCSVVKKDGAVILYDAAVSSKRRRNWTIAHECGHILLKHQKSGAKEEAEADAFAASFLLPEAAIRAMDHALGRPLTPQELYACFPASLSACRTRRAELNARPYFPTAYDEQLLNRLFPQGPEAFLPGSGPDSDPIPGGSPENQACYSRM